MPRHKYSAKEKIDVDIDAIVNAIKELTIGKKSFREVSAAFKIDKSKLSRYIAKLNEDKIDPTTASDAILNEYFSNLCGKTGGKTVCCFFFFFKIIFLDIL